MTPSAILDRLHAAGVRVRPDPQNPDRLRLSPPDRLNAELLALARDHKRELLAELRERSRPTPEELAGWGEYLMERASIMEHDGELPRRCVARIPVGRPGTVGVRPATFRARRASGSDTPSSRDA